MEALTLTLTLLVGAAVPLGWRAARHARFTSLVPATRWETASLVAIGAVELWIGSGSGADDGVAAWVAPLRWVAASTVFCGWMARLGARRPHGAGWQFVVASLWGVLALPAAEVFFLQSGQAFEIHAARGIFLWIMLAGGLANSLPTRDWPAGILAALGQTILLADHLPGLRFELAPADSTRAIATGALTLLTAALAWRAMPESTVAARPGLNGVWLDFRDQFGAWWGLRLLERINAAATLGRWPVHLRWNGFEHNEVSADAVQPNDSPRRDAEAVDALRPEDHAALRQAMWNMLRRFVAPPWIAGRLGDIADDS